jgi:competence protein ComFC
MGFLNTIKNNILDIVFPETCLSCGKDGSYLCKTCLLQSPAAERETLEWIYPLFDYRHPAIKKSITFFKYKGRKNLVDVLADVVYERMIEELSELKRMENFENPLIIPVPLSPRRYKERGFNQSEVLARKIIEKDKEKIFTLVTNALVKTKDTPNQADIKDRGERLKNLSGSFALKDNSLIKDKNIILIDDVTTTGTTLLEARKILKQGGAKKVIAFTVAH